MKKDATNFSNPRAATDADDEMLPEYDFHAGVRGKYAEGTNVVLLDPDLACIFRTTAEVNRALRKLLETGYRPSDK